MALEKRYNDQDNKQQGDASASNSANAMKSNQQEQVSSYLTFEGAGFGLDLANAANAIGQKMNELFATAKREFHIRVFDREKYESQYSFITVAALNSTGSSAYYYTILLSETGPDPLTAEQFVERINSDNISEEGVAGVYTLDVMLDARTIEIVEAEIKEDFPNANLIEIGSSVVDGPIATKLLDVANHIVKHLMAAIALETGEDLNLPYALEQESDGRRPAELRVNYRYIPDGIVQNGLGTNVKAEFELKLTKHSKVRGYNVSNSNRELTTVYGYFDYVVEEVMERVGRDEMPKVKLIPHIILTEMKLNKYTTNFSLLATVTAAIMTNKEMLIGHMLKNRDDLAATIAIITLQDKKSAKAIEELKKCSDEEFVAIIQETMLMEPIISIDIENNGATEYLSPFVTAAITGDKQEILSSAAVLADRVELSSANLDVFAHMVKLPKVQYFRNTERDGRDFTLQHILSTSKDIEKAYDYNHIMNGKDAIIDGIELLSEFIPDGDVKGTILRLTIHPAFLETLYNALGIDNITYNALFVPNIRERRFNTHSDGMRIRGSYFRPASSGATRTRGTYDPFRR